MANQQPVAVVLVKWQKGLAVLNALDVKVPSVNCVCEKQQNALFCPKSRLGKNSFALPIILRNEITKDLWTDSAWGLTASKTFFSHEFAKEILRKSQNDNTKFYLTLKVFMILRKHFTSGANLASFLKLVITRFLWKFLKFLKVQLKKLINKYKSISYSIFLHLTIFLWFFSNFRQFFLFYAVFKFYFLIILKSNVKNIFWKWKLSFFFLFFNFFQFFNNF